MTNAGIIEDLTLIPLPPWWQDPWAILALAAGAGMLAALLWWWIRRPVPAPIPPPPPPGPPAHEWALAELASLRSRPGTWDDYELAIALSDLLRRFIDARFGLPIRFQTTREFLDAAATAPEIDLARRTLLGEFLGACDGVKFARRTAGAGGQERLFSTAERFIREVSRG